MAQESPPAQSSKPTITDQQVKALLAEVEYLRAQTFRQSEAINERVAEARLLADRMLEVADQDQHRRSLQSARTLLDCLHRGINAAA